MRGPRASNQLGRVGGGPSGGGGALWTPPSIVGVQFILDPDLAATYGGSLPANNASVPSMYNALGDGRSLDQGTSGRQFKFTTSSLNGHFGVKGTQGANTGAFCASGGLTGNAAHTLAVVAVPTGVAAGFSSIVAYGGTESAQNSVVGYGSAGATYWGGGAGKGTPVGGTATLALHLFEKTSNGTTSTVYVDGTQVASGGNTFNLAAGFALASFNSNQQWDSTVYYAVWVSGVWSVADRTLFRTWVNAHFGMAVTP